MLPLVLIALLTTAVVAGPIERQLFAPTVQISNGTVVGLSTNNLVDTFLGVPYAQPPVGNLRLKPPQPVNKNWGTFLALTTPRGCPQFASQFDLTNSSSVQDAANMNNPTTQAALNFGEDCLTLDIYRPAGVSSTAKLPVVYWIYGGGFEVGWTSTYDFTQWIQQSVVYGKPMIAVAVNYRLGGFGFLAGSDLAKEHSTNLGLRDQRLGMQWVADNIAAFGGDPSKVTIWGESAGAMSVFDHTVINNGDNSYKGKPLFRAAMMNSGSIMPADNVTASKPQAVYDQVVGAAGCSNAADRLACLRAADYQTFLTATQTVPSLNGPAGFNFAYLPRPDAGDSFYPTSAEQQLLLGNYVKVPTIIGTLLDEGTLFAQTPTNLDTNADVVNFLGTLFPRAAGADVTNFTALYPDDPSQGQPFGSPFGTGGQHNSYPQQKRLAAMLGDLTFIMARRVYLDFLVKNGVTAYSYVASYLSGTDQLPVLGTFHGSDLVVLFKPLQQLTLQSIVWRNFYISFIHDLNPNTITSIPAQASWDQYSSTRRNVIDIGAAGPFQTTDTFRLNASTYLAAKLNTFHY